MGKGKIAWKRKCLYLVSSWSLGCKELIYPKKQAARENQNVTWISSFLLPLPKTQPQFFNHKGKEYDENGLVFGEVLFVFEKRIQIGRRKEDGKGKGSES